MSSHLKPKLLRRFYEVLILLRVLGQVQGERIRAPDLEDGSLDRLDLKQMRRLVMYHLCVMCDYEKGGATVTAMAAQNHPSGPQYWIAVNGSLSKIRKFLVETLASLQARAGETLSSPSQTTTSFEQTLFTKFAEIQRARTKTYWDFMQKHVKTELKRAEAYPTRRAKNLGYAAWLEPLQSSRHRIDPHGLCELAYQVRRSSYLRVDYDPVSGGSVFTENEARSSLRHLVGRLCAVKRAARILTYACASHPQLFEGANVLALKCPAATPAPSAYPGLTSSGISNRVFPSSSSTELQDFQAVLQRLEDQGMRLIDGVRDYYASKDWRPKVHAELTLLEALHAHQGNFFDNDKYIACSKPACFCCYHYICAHPGGFARPDCHNKVYHSWQPPALPSTTSSKLKDEQSRVMNSLVQQVRQAVVEKVSNIRRYAKWHADSTTGLTAFTVESVAGSEVGDHCGDEEEVFSGASDLVEDGPTQADVTSDGSEESEDGGVSLL
ncbi:hypothetical protein LTR78_002257 [Recurvomyces mirabilis]|uniref:Uncharacterized protein n=1 Tax=Recurvomyces mirabilis TaxID=574656 RepID=A0AAE0WU40_9PEZI|nr:hypothetical protein LTR78_002257 [Recurvomyces mirabilis]KAK5160712.1 hypothetical protein LTS14_001725 [Recurvomyces mirabilis]